MKQGTIYTCECCGEKHERAYDDEVAIKEYEQYFGRFDAGSVSIVCEDCWQKMHPANHPHLVEEAMREQSKLDTDA